MIPILPAILLFLLFALTFIFPPLGLFMEGRRITAVIIGLAMITSVILAIHVSPWWAVLTVALWMLSFLLHRLFPSDRNLE